MSSTISVGASPFQVNEGNAGTTPISIAINRTGDLSGAASANWSVATGGGLDGADFVGGAMPSGTVSFAAGESSKTVTLNIQGDTLVEANEPISFSLSSPTGAVLGNSFAFMSLLNDDGAILQTVSTALSNEGNAASVPYTITVTRSGDTGIAATADWAVVPAAFIGTAAISAADFVGNALPSGTVSFAAGETSKTISFNIAGDTVFEPNESFILQLSNPSGGAAIGTTYGYTLLNDDGTVITFSGGNPAVNEGNAGTTPMTFTVVRSGDLSEAVSVDWAYNSFGMTTNAADFVGGVLPSGTVNFAIGQSSQTITVNIQGDTVTEPTETLAISLSNASPNATLGGFTTQTGNIVNDDGGGAVISMGSNPLSVNEGNAGSTPITFTVTRSGDTTSAVSASWMVNPGGMDGADFAGGNLPTGTVFFAAGQTTSNFVVNVAGDTLLEGNENFSVSLFSPSSGASIGLTSSAFGLVNNDDGAVLATTNVTGFGVNEGNAGTTPFTITITRSGDTSIAASANWTVAAPIFGGVSPVSADDFAGGAFPSGTVSFAIGETSKTIIVNLAADTVFEPNETFVVNLTNPSSGAAIGNSVSYTITNDDGVVFSFASAPASVVEGNSGASPMIFTVNRSGDTSVAATVNWAVDGSFATTNAADYVGGVLPSGTLSFAAGETSKTITIDLAGDSTVESNETVPVRLSSPSAGATIGSFSLASGTVLNDDPTGLSIAASNPDQMEGNAGSTAYSFVVTRSGDTAGASTVNWAFSTAGISTSTANANDFTGAVTPAGGTLSFAAGETAKTITVNVAGDTTWENDERFSIVLSNATGAVIGTGTATVVIRNDEVPFDGTSGPDTVTGGANNDLVRGFAGDDSLEGGAGNDTLDGGEGADRLTGGAGGDRFALAINSSARSTLASMDVITDFSKSEGDVISFGATNGTLTIGAETRSFFVNYDTGLSSIDTPVAGLSLPAQNFNIPTFQGFWVQDVDVMGNDQEGGWLIVDVNGDQILDANDLIVQINGNPADLNNDLAFVANELLPDVQLLGTVTPPTGSNGNDTLNGSGRGETFVGTNGADVLNGGAGAGNTLSYAGFTTPVIVTYTGINSGTVDKGAGNVDSFSNFNSVLGGSGNDRFDTTGITLQSFYSVNLTGNGGNDSFTGGFMAQDDGTTFANAVVNFSNGTAAATVNLGTGTASDGLGGTDTLVNIRRVAFNSNFNDTLIGSSFSDQVGSSSNGNRSIDAGAGGSDRWSMGTNSRDSLGVANVRVEVELGTGTSGGEFTGVARKYAFTSGAWTLTGTDTLRSVEQVNGSIGHDSIVGSDAANSFFGGEGNDTMDGGLGLDSVRYDSFTGASNLPVHGVTINLNAGTATDAWGFTDTLISIENAFGTQLADEITGVGVAGSRTLLRGLGGNDVLGAPALDTLVTADYRGDRGAVTINLATGMATDGWGDTDTLVNIQSAAGSRFGDSITGGARADLLEGAGGDDSIAGGGGTDVVLFTGARAGYTITYDAGLGRLTVADCTASRDGTDILVNDIETLRFSDGDHAFSSFTAAPPPSLAIAALAADQTEGHAGLKAFTFTVTRSGDTSGASSAAWAVTGSGANPASGADFQSVTLPSGTVSFAAGETSKTITVNVLGETAVEPDEGFTVTLSSPTGASITTAAASGTIRNDDAQIAIQGSPPVAEGSAGTTAVTFTVTRTGDTSTAVSAAWAVTGSGASQVDAADFDGGVLPTGTVSFAAGETTQTITVNVVGDTAVEPNEQFTVTLSSPSTGATLGAALSTRLILNDDALLNIAPLSADRAEGQSGSTPFTFTVTRVGDTSGTASASYAVTGSGGLAANAADFTGNALPGGTVSFAAGETSKIITVNVAGDTTAEGDEGFTVTLSAPTGATLQTAVSGGTIRNDDSVVSVSGGGSVAEGNAGSTPLTFTVTRSGDISGAASVNWAIAGTSGQPADAGDFVGGTMPGDILNFAAGEASRTITVNILGDTIAELNEEFTLVLSGPSAGMSIGTPTAQGVIVNDDALLSIAPLAATRAEGNAGANAFTFTVNRIGDATGAASASWAVTGSGGNPAAAADFVGGVLPGGTVSFAAGQTSRTITVSVAGETAWEADEGFTVTLSDPVGAALGTASATGTIQNDDATVFSVAALAASQGEGDAGPSAFTFTVTRTGDSSAAQSIAYSVIGSGANAANALDFTGGALPSGMVDFAVGETSKVLTINVAGDVAFEATEGFAVRITTAIPGTVTGTAVAYGAIGNDDSPAILGTASNDTLTGTAAGELVSGLNGNDLLDGAGGDDSVSGGAGNDTLLASDGSDVMDGGAGIDTLVFGPAFAAVNVIASLAVGIAHKGAAGDDTLAGIENITGDAGDDTLTGDALANALIGGGGDDRLTGGGGNDSLTGGMGLDRFNVDAGTDRVLDLGLGGADELVVAAGAMANATLADAWTATADSANDGVASLTAQGFDVDLSAATGANGWSVTNAGNGTGVSLTGSAAADSLTGGTGEDMLTGGAGIDRLAGGAGIDRFEVDLDNDIISDLGLGGADILAIAAGATADATLAAAWTATADSSNNGTANLVAAGFNANLALASGANGWSVTNAGSTRAVTLTGSENDDTLTGGSNNDVLSGNLGDDVMTGGLGIDRFLVDAGTDQVTDLGIGGADVLIVSAGAMAQATLGANWAASGSTSNAGTALLAAAGFNVTLTAATGTMGWNVTNQGGAGAVALTGSGRADSLTGGDGQDSLGGGGGNDTVSGGLGDDQLTGGAGIDRFDVTDGTDTVTDLGFGGADVLAVSAGATANATLAAGWTATAASSNAGTAGLSAAGFNVNLAAATGANGWSVSNAGQAGAVLLTGSAQADSLTGGDGQDSLVGGAGMDVLTGGLGDDRLTGGTAADSFLVDAGVDAVTDLGLGGADILLVSAGATANATLAAAWVATAASGNAGAANVTALGFNIDLTLAGGAAGWSVSNAGSAKAVTFLGSAQADALTGGTGADTIRGGDGADTLLGDAGNDQLFGGAGQDVMTGGAGIDRFNVDGGTDTVTDLGFGGGDVLIVSAGATAMVTAVAAWTASGGSSNAGMAQLSSAGFNLNLAAATGANGWSLTNSSGTGASFNGSGRADLLTGGAGSDTLLGAGGNDTLLGGLGADSMTGGAGADSFLFNAIGEGEAGDVITDFSVAQGDRIDLRPIDTDAGLAGDQGFTFIGAGAFSSTAGELRFAAGLLQADLDGNGVADFQVAVTGIASLTAASFWL